MIKILCEKDIELVNDSYIKSYLKKQLNYLLDTYRDECSDGSLKAIEAIYFVESQSDFDDYTQFELSVSITKSRFEWIEPISNEYCRGFIVINNSKSIELIGKTTVFDIILKEEK